MTTKQRLDKVEKSMTRAQVLHDAARRIVEIEQEAAKAYAAAGGDEDAFFEALAELTERDE